jgi:hypothetical protein
MSCYPINIINKPIVSAQSMASSFNGNVSAVQVSEAVRLGIQAIWTGTAPVGTLQVTCSNDGVNFSNDPEQASPVAISGASGNVMIKISNCAYEYVSVSYVATSGTGSITITVDGKAE